MRRRTASGSRAASMPSTTMRPPVGCCSVASMRSVEVLPAPLGPTSANRLPGAMVNDSACTASRRPSYDRDTDSQAIIADFTGAPPATFPALLDLVVDDGAQRREVEVATGQHHRHAPPLQPLAQL